MKIVYNDYTQNVGRYKSIGLGEAREIAKRNRQALLILQDQLGANASITPEMICNLARKLK